VEKGWLAGLQLCPLKGLVVLFRFVVTETVRLQFPIAAMQQGVDQTVGQFFWANAIVLGGNGKGPGPLPCELNHYGLEIFRDPCATKARKYEGVVTTGGSGADFIVLLRKQSCFEDVSVGAGNGHNCIVRPRVKRTTVLRAPRR
jgi:hypothetical protein